MPNETASVERALDAKRTSHSTKPCTPAPRIITPTMAIRAKVKLINSMRKPSMISCHR